MNKRPVGPIVVSLAVFWAGLYPLKEDYMFRTIKITLFLLLARPHVWAEEGVTMPTSGKTSCVLYPSTMVAKARANAAAHPWAAAMSGEVVSAATPWLKLSDDELWDLMFGPHITRSWMVWSNGFCPECKNDVRMYHWQMDPWEHQWKVRCPHCGTFFPTNDFEAFHRSGLDEHGVFIPARADRSLLFNAAHPDPNDPLHTFGVDDGEGYVDAEGHRWRFIGAYLIYGQWKRLVVDGIDKLSSAYLVTGEPEYARRAAILLDRVADIFPQFDFSTQGLVYEYGPHRGQVSTWHDACGEMMTLTKSYDRIFEAARAQEQELVALLSGKARQYRLENPKASWADIQRNIEERIFRETLAHRERIESNYPTTDRAIIYMNVALGWPETRDQVLAHLDAVIQKSTAVDGMSGEKGLAGYTVIAPHNLAYTLAALARIEPGFLRAIYERHPVLHRTYRFHVDTWCLDGLYYPQVGDTGGFARRNTTYGGIGLNKSPGTEPSMYSFLWDLHELTGDPVFVQILYRGNGSSLEGLPYDLFAEDPAAFQAKVKKVIDEVGTVLPQASVNLKQWRLAVLRGGDGEDRRALWIDYDSGERHSHADGMNIGLFAKGLDLMPEFGYPAVGYGGWGSQKGRWYTRTAAHNTVVVDGKDQKRVNSGTTTLWADGERFRAIRVSDPAMIEGRRYERTVAMIDIDERDIYVLDYFLVEGGTDHAKFFHSGLGRVTTDGLELAPTEDFGHETETRNFRIDRDPAPGWYVDWAIEDRHHYLPEGANIHLRHTDLTRDAHAYLAEAWVDTTLFGGTAPEYIPCIMTRRTAETGPLVSAFVAVIEPYEIHPKTDATKRVPPPSVGEGLGARQRTEAAEPVALPSVGEGLGGGEPNLARIERVLLVGADGSPLPDTFAGIEIQRKDGRTDLCVFAEPGSASEVLMPERRLRVRGELGLVSLRGETPEHLVLCRGTGIEVGAYAVTLKEPTEFLELVFRGNRVRVGYGNLGVVAAVTRDGKPMKISE